MESLSQIVPTLPAWVVPVFIFLARIVDVSLGTVRIILVARGLRFSATILGFLEIFIWLIAIGQIMQNLHSIENFLAYSAGFAAGTFVGMTIEQRLAIGSLMIRMIVPRDAGELIERLKEIGCRLTRVEANGTVGPVQIVFTVVKRKILPKVVGAIRAYDPELFYTVEDVRLARHPVTPRHGGAWRVHLLQPFYWFRKSK